MTDSLLFAIIAVALILSSEALNLLIGFVILFIIIGR
jgi:hypothetical protein